MTPTFPTARSRCETPSRTSKASQELDHQSRSLIIDFASREQRARKCACALQVAPTVGVGWGEPSQRGIGMRGSERPGRGAWSPGDRADRRFHAAERVLVGVRRLRVAGLLGEVIGVPFLAPRMLHSSRGLSCVCSPRLSGAAAYEVSRRPGGNQGRRLTPSRALAWPQARRKRDDECRVRPQSSPARSL